MKRSVAIFAAILSVAVIIGLLLAPAVFAQRDAVKDRIEDVKDKAAAVKDKVVDKAKDRPEKIVNTAVRTQKREEVLKQEVFQKLQEKDRIKIERLNSEKVERLSQLDEQQLENVRELKQDRLRVLASESNDTLRRITTGLGKTDVQKLAALDRSRIKEVARLPPEEAKARLAKLSVIKAGENFRIRPMEAAAKEARTAAFEKLKKNGSELKEEFRERLDSLKEVKEKARLCGNDTQSEECANAHTAALERAKEAAFKAVDRILTHLQKLKNRIESSENMPADEAVERVAKIDAAIAEVETVKQKISAVTTKKELNDAVKELKDMVKKVKRRSEAHSQGLLRAEIHGVIQRSEVLEKKLDCALSGLEANGTDTAVVDAKLAEFSSKMGTAREKLKTAKELLDSDNETTIAEGKRLVREARDLVQEAHRLLEEIRKDIRDLDGQPCREEQEIVVEETLPPAPEAPAANASANETPTTT